MAGLEKRICSVLVVSVSENFNNALSALLPVSRYDPIRYVSGISAAKRTLSERDFDLVIVNSPLYEDIGTEFAIDAGSNSRTTVMFIAGADVLEGLREKFIAAGVFPLPKPLTTQTFSLALDWSVCVRERLRKLETKAISIEEKMTEIRLVNRAKWLLITELKMEEPQAHHFIEKQAMDRCITRREIAEEIIRTYSS